jgi:hypothetical protein
MSASERDINLSKPSSQLAEGPIDLAPQQRNLLLMRPLFQLELTKTNFQMAAAALSSMVSTRITLALLRWRT